jgi:integrase
LTLQRRGEVVGMRFADLDLRANVWTIPGATTKNHRTHVVPLSPQAVAAIEAALSLRSGQGRASPFVLPSPRSRDEAVGAMALTHAWRRLLPHVLVGPDERPLANATPHDLRRTGATNLTSERIGVSRFVVSRLLNHSDASSSSVTAIYDRNEYLAEKRQALNAWAELLSTIVQGGA